MSTMSTSTMPAPPSATSISYYPSGAMTTTVTVWDAECGCHKTTTTAVSLTSPPAATGTSPARLYTWYDTICGCHMTAAVPTMPAMSANYTAPMQPPATMAPAAATSAPAAPATSSPAPYQGAATQIARSVVFVLGAAAALSFAL